MCTRPMEFGDLIWLPYLKKIHTLKLFHFSDFQAWDYHPQVGLIVAGGYNPYSTSMNISRDYGKTVEELANIPYANTGCNTAAIWGGCLVIVNTTTVFFAGGYGERFSGQNKSNYQIPHQKFGFRESRYRNGLKSGIKN